MITGEVQTWRHSRKGTITGVVVHDAPKWIVVKLVGDQHYALDGATAILEKALMTEVPA